MRNVNQIDLERFLKDQREVILEYVEKCKLECGLYSEDKYIKDWIRLYAEEYRNGAILSGKYDTIE
jgi:hypothetical protein|tara:strand:- start:1875 stop:2072 length:198 start_codon:yes stop_codon:yes gene_type:complete